MCATMGFPSSHSIWGYCRQSLHVLCINPIVWSVNGTMTHRVRAGIQRRPKLHMDRLCKLGQPQTQDWHVLLSFVRILIP